jgi:hypothetical protein
MSVKARHSESGFHFMATGIGSVPSVDIHRTCMDILDHFPQTPFWPQFVKRTYLEDMTVQFSEGLSFLEISAERRAPVLRSGNIESELAAFYDRFFAEEIEHFAMSTDFAPGLHALVSSIRKNPDRYGPYVKGQTVGPITLAAAIHDHDGKALLYNPDLADAMSKGLAIKALWQVRELSKSGKQPIVFLDEPSLSGFGSAFTPIQRHEVINLLREVMDYLREKANPLLGIHCCGNTDWSMIMEAGPDIVSFDAFTYMDHFLLYRKEISRFLQSGGTIAWGIVPTGEYTPLVSAGGLYSKLKEGLERLYQWGLDREAVKRHSLLTPACGMGNMEQAAADRVLDLLSELSRMCEKAD